MKDNKPKISPTDGLEPIYSNSNPPPFGLDICGRSTLHRDGRPGFPTHVMAMEKDLFRRCMERYQERTGRKINVPVWSFPHEDTWPFDEKLAELRRLQKRESNEIDTGTA